MKGQKLQEKLSGIAKSLDERGESESVLVAEHLSSLNEMIEIDPELDAEFVGAAMNEIIEAAEEVKRELDVK